MVKVLFWTCKFVLSASVLIARSDVSKPMAATATLAGTVRSYVHLGPMHLICGSFQRNFENLVGKGQRFWHYCESLIFPFLSHLELKIPILDADSFPQSGITLAYLHL
jgi:hypothetical protein